MQGLCQIPSRLWQHYIRRTFHRKVEVVQYNTCLAIAGVIRDFCEKKLYEEFEIPLASSLVQKTLFYKPYKNEYLQYLFKFCKEARSSGYITGSMSNIAFFKIRLNFFKNIFLPSAIIKWHNLDHILRNPSTFNIYRNMKSIRPNCFLIVLILK